MLNIILYIIFIILICYLKYRIKQRSLKGNKNIISKPKSYYKQGDQEKARRRRQLAKGIIK